MKIQIVQTRQSPDFMHQLHIKVMAEHVDESPLHQLPQLIDLFSICGLNAYNIHFLKNKEGRFDIEMIGQYPRICRSRENTSKQNHSPQYSDKIEMSVLQKFLRLQRLYYPKSDSNHQSSIIFDYFDFIKRLQSISPRYSTWSDQQLFSFPRIFDQLDKAYAQLMANNAQQNDPDYSTLSNEPTFQLPALNSKSCAFDRPELVEQQCILRSHYFRIAFNYQPLPGTPFHLMIISNSHEANLRTATPEHLFELEAMLRTLMQIGSQFSSNIKLFMQNHATAGMTVPHMHIQAVIPPAEKHFNEMMIQQLRYFSRLISHASTKGLDDPPLSAAEMASKARTLRPQVEKSLSEQFYRQYQRFTVFKPTRPLPLIQEQKAQSHSEVNCSSIR